MDYKLSIYNYPLFIGYCLSPLHLFLMYVAVRLRNKSGLLLQLETALLYDPYLLTHLYCGYSSNQLPVWACRHLFLSPCILRLNYIYLPVVQITVATPHKKKKEPLFFSTFRVRLRSKLLEAHNFILRRVYIHSPVFLIAFRSFATFPSVAATFYFVSRLVCLLQAVANSTSATFLRVVGSELIQKYLGDGPKLVRELFRVADDLSPSIVFIDEIDAIGTKRYANEHFD